MSGVWLCVCVYGLLSYGPSTSVCISMDLGACVLNVNQCLHVCFLLYLDRENRKHRKEPFLYAASSRLILGLKLGPGFDVDVCF